MTEAEFSHFLELLSSAGGGEDGGKCYVRLLKKLEGFFTLKGVSDPVGATDTTIALAARKIAEGTPVPHPERYCMGVARNIAREEQRRQRREAKVFLGFIEDLDNDVPEQVARIDQVLRPCFEQLPERDKELLVAYCQVLRGRARAEHRRELASRMNLTVQALRMCVTRLRETLTKCVEKQSKES